MRVCAEPGCPALIEAGTRDGRCTQHQRARDRARGRRQQRGYDAKHGQLKREYQGDMDSGVVFTCWRCLEPVDPKQWCLGHCDDDRSRYHGPEHPACNYATASHRGGPCPHPDHGSVSHM